MDRPRVVLTDKQAIALTREAILDVERLRDQSLELLAESRQLLDLIDEIGGPHIHMENKRGGSPPDPVE
jgi:hypothetical protein